MTDLAKKHCIPCEGGVTPLTADASKKLLQELSGWKINATSTEINRNFKFSNYYETMAFVNAIAWVSHYENHHPDLEVSYNHCNVRYSTHAIKGLSENDFICATKVNEIFAEAYEKTCAIA